MKWLKTKKYLYFKVGNKKYLSNYDNRMKTKKLLKNLKLIRFLIQQKY